MIEKSDGLVHLVGKVGRAPTFQARAGGGEVMTLGLSTRPSASPETPGGNQHRTTRRSWHRVVAVAPAVHRAARDLALNDDVSVHGFIERRQYERDGKRHELWEIVAERIERLRRA